MPEITNGVLYYIGHAFNIEYFAQFVNKKRNILRNTKEVQNANLYKYKKRL